MSTESWNIKVPNGGCDECELQRMTHLERALYDAKARLNGADTWIRLATSRDDFKDLERAKAWRNQWTAELERLGASVEREK
jgi:hypothetical protein